MINTRELQAEVFAKLRDIKIQKKREKREKREYIEIYLRRIEDLLEYILEEIK